LDGGIYNRKKKEAHMSCIPSKEAEFVAWSGNLATASAANKTAWSLPEDKLTESCITGGKALHAAIP
jgi:hypothetical protein